MFEGGGLGRRRRALSAGDMVKDEGKEGNSAPPSTEDEGQTSAVKRKPQHGPRARKECRESDPLLISGGSFDGL